MSHYTSDQIGDARELIRALCDCETNNDVNVVINSFDQMRSKPWFKTIIDGFEAMDIELERSNFVNRMVVELTTIQRDRTKPLIAKS